MDNLKYIKSSNEDSAIAIYIGNEDMISQYHKYVEHAEQYIKTADEIDEYIKTNYSLGYEDFDKSILNSQEIYIIGGCIHRDAILSQTGNCFIDPKSDIWGNGRVEDNAILLNTTIMGHINVSGDSIISNSRMYAHDTTMHIFTFTSHININGHSYIKNVNIESRMHHTPINLTNTCLSCNVDDYYMDIVLNDHNEFDKFNLLGVTFDFNWHTKDEILSLFMKHNRDYGSNKNYENTVTLKHRISGGYNHTEHLCIPAAVFLKNICNNQYV
jgi:NDP-sugar pyrophosphorylase family protein